MVYLSCKDIKGALNGNEKDYSGTSLEKGMSQDELAEKFL